MSALSAYKAAIIGGIRRCRQRLTSGPMQREQLLRGQGISPGYALTVPPAA
jgi:hypothetical protein